MNARVRLGQLLLCCSLAKTASAEPASELERAKQSFQAGATAYAAGEYLAAIQALDAAYALTPLPAIAFSLAQAERKQYFVDHEGAHLDRAISLFRQYITQVSSGGRRADALDALGQLEPLAAVARSAGAEHAAPDRDAVRRTRVLVTSETPGARLSLDGAAPVPSPLIGEVEPGKHRVAVSAPGFFAAQREITAVAGELMFAAVPLRERASTLAIWSPVNAELYLDGAFVSLGGDQVTLQLASGKHRLSVAAKGHVVSRQVVDIERGKAVNLRVTLEPTAQRTVSEGLFLGGGVALGAGLVLSAFSARAQSRAQAFLGRRAQGNVTSGDLHSYDTDVSQRDRYRLATEVSFAGAAGLFITGLFLHELDQPNAQELYGTGPASDSQRSPSKPREPEARLRLAPTVGPSSIGTTLRLAF